MNTAGYMRGTMGIPYLLDGISPIPAMIGLLAAGQLLTLVTKDFIVDGGVRVPSVCAASSAVAWIRSNIPACCCAARHRHCHGYHPGVGSAVANLISYAETKRAARTAIRSARQSQRRHRRRGCSRQRRGRLDGDHAHARHTWPRRRRCLLAAFMMHNVVAGPSLIRQHKPMVYALILNNIVEAVALLGVGLGFIYVASNVVRLRTRYIVPVVLVLAIMGTYSLDGTISRPDYAFCLHADRGGDGALQISGSRDCRRILLGRMLETQAVLSYELISGQPAYILRRPAALAILAVMMLSLGVSAWSRRRRRARRIAAMRESASSVVIGAAH